MGSLALSLCHLAAGRVDAVASLRPARSVDIAAAQLLVRERGLAVELFDDPPLSAAPLDLVPRSRIAAAATPDGPARRLVEPLLAAEYDSAMRRKLAIVVVALLVVSAGGCRHRHQGDAEGACDGAQGQRQVALLDQGHEPPGQGRFGLR